MQRLSFLNENSCHFLFKNTVEIGTVKLYDLMKIARGITDTCTSIKNAKITIVKFHCKHVQVFTY